ncbi:MULTISPECIES: hypothetical protein [unclassified Paenibacillus]|uniref:hypothetical protein n=1 Tax=unclassified Paenibacillus TaxID=185978 RepID=UPI001AEA417E|nr:MULTISPECIES: hypothetical protein [unclassified Paenibacillus]MBP1154238.1 hypothetical protein [Paenibacillus sp. PvP091]MBP1170377.1 hypothetical protein [Paenibacillus sp. PvR098]MBP2441405.1 hypothetical protein [Paenibacillus sp. PvP052]
MGSDEWEKPKGEEYRYLQQHIEEERQLNGELLAKLATLKRGLQLPEVDEEYIVLIRKKTKESVLLLHGQNEVDVLALHESYKRKKLGREQEIAIVEQEIHKKKQMLGMLLNEVEKASGKIAAAHSQIKKEDTDKSSKSEALKKNYIAGKRAGEDLHDQEGKLLIAEGDLITMEVIEKAKRLNLLTQLILHMNMLTQSK